MQWYSLWDWHHPLPPRHTHTRTHTQTHNFSWAAFVENTSSLNPSTWLAVTPQGTLAPPTSLGPCWHCPQQQITWLQSLLSALLLLWLDEQGHTDPPPPHRSPVSLHNNPRSERPTPCGRLVTGAGVASLHNELFMMSEEHKLRTESALKVIIKSESFAKNKLWLTSVFSVYEVHLRKQRVRGREEKKIFLFLSWR